MGKRTNCEGTIYQDKNGLWRGELTLGYDDGGKRIKRQFSSMSLDTLQKKINDEKFKLNRNIVTVSSDYTVKEWLEFWLQTYKLNSIKPSTYDYYETALNVQIFPAIGNIKLDKLKSTHIQQLYNNMHNKGLATSTIKSAHIPLNQALEQAINNELIYKNPCNGVTIPKKPPRESRTMTIEEQEIFVNSCNGSAYHNFFIFLLNTGMRCGEGRAITWSDIDFNDMTITVNKSMVNIKNRDADATTSHIQTISTTKTESGVRTIPINKNCLKILQMQPRDNIFVFSSRAKTPFGERNTIREFKGLLAKSNLPDCLTIHSLRHTFATRLLEK